MPTPDAKEERAVRVVKITATLIGLIPFTIVGLLRFFPAIRHGQSAEMVPTVMMSAGAIIFFFYGTGALLYVGGFATYRQSQALANLPRNTIRAAPMGLVEIEGKAVAETMRTSPFTHTPCCAYRMRIDRWVHGDSTRYEKLLEVDEGRFFLEDETGRVLVGLRELEFDQSPWYRVVAFDPQDHTIINLCPSPVPDEELRFYVLKVLPQLNVQYVELSESVILPGTVYSLTATCAENPEATGDADRKIMIKGEHDPTFHIAPRTREAEIKRLRSHGYIFMAVGAALAMAGLLAATIVILVGMVVRHASAPVH